MRQNYWASFSQKAKQIKILLRSRKYMHNASVLFSLHTLIVIFLCVDIMNNVGQDVN